MRDGLHILGQVPQGEQLRGLLERDPAAAGLPRGGAGLRPPAARSSARSWRDGSKTGDPATDAVLELAENEVLPKLLATADEIPALIGGLHGRFVVAGPSGSPTRGRLDVLPTGRNMYSVDPRALPSDLAYETGVKLADALLAQHDELPETVGIVVWGTAAMRTAGDDAGEILALLGVRPRWNPETRRIVGPGRDLAGGARPPADRRHRAHLGLLPRRVPAPRRRAGRRGDAGRRSSTSRSS